MRRRIVIVGSTTAAVLAALIIRGYRPEVVRPVPDVIPDWMIDEAQRRRT